MSNNFDKKVYISDLEANQHLEEAIFGLAARVDKVTRNGKKYLDLTLIDSSGSLGAKLWENNLTNLASLKFSEGDVVAVSGDTSLFRDQLQLSITDLKILNEEEAADYISEIVQTSQYSKGELSEKLSEFIDRIEDEEILKLVKAIMADYEQDFLIWPAATLNHHQFQGGLAEHTLEMLTISDSICKFYPQVNKDIVFAAILLHDFAKLFELEKNSFSFKYSGVGKLVGHIVMANNLVDEYLGKLFGLDFKARNSLNKFLLIKHAILAHHGEMEYGSPVVPQTIEAEVVSKADDLSWSTRAFSKVMSENDSSSSEFSQRVFALQRKVFLDSEKAYSQKIHSKDTNSQTGAKENPRKNPVESGNTENLGFNEILS